MSNDQPELGDEKIEDLELAALKELYKLMTPAYSTDGLDNVIHVFDITKMVSLVKKGSYRIVALDSIGILSCWVIIENSEGDDAGSLTDLTLRVGGKIKLALHSVVNINEKLGIHFDPETFEIEFDPSDQNSFIFSTSEGVYYSKLYNQAGDSTSLKGGPVIRKLDSSSVGEFIRVTSMSYSDQGFILVGFEEGSIGLYNKEFSSPLSIWYNA